MDWEWWAFKDPCHLEAEQRQTADGGFQAVTRFTCERCKKASYHLWVFTGSGSGAPSLYEKQQAALKELAGMMSKHCPEHPDFVKKA